MFKIYIGTVPVYLCTADTEQQVGQNPNILHVTYRHKYDLKDIIKYIEANTHLQSVFITGSDLSTVRKDFFGQYKVLAAAGGMVRNSNGEVLFINRNNRWDLPKGKVEADEALEDAAKREVSEETGLSLENLQIKAPIMLGDMQQNITCHTYFEKGIKVLKLIYWYDMFCDNTNGLKPQEEEGIIEACFLSLEAIKAGDYLQNTFPSIRDVLRAGLAI
jgi:8-oxo-dGTP pyrophosphatase MutT (NUDIX family)